MGNKCSASSKGISHKKHLHQNLVTDQPHFNEKPQPLKFILEIDKIKCKNLSQTDCYVSFNFPDQKQITTGIIPNDRNPRWKKMETFEFITDTLSIKASELIINIKNKAEKILSTLRISLYDIATGPVYHDFSLENKSSSIKGRLAFNLKMKQRVKIIIEPIKIQCELIELLSEMSYNFSLRFISADGTDLLQTEHSDSFINNFSLLGALEKNRDHSQSQSHSVDEGESLYEDFNHEMNEGDKKLQHITVPKNENYKDSLYKISHTQTNESVRKKISALNLKKMEKDSLHHEKPKKHEILWNYNNNLSLWPIKPPSIDVEITSNDFSSSCMQFFLWAPKEIVEKDGEENPYALKIHDEEEKKSINFHVNPVKLIGECYININKLFQDDIRIFDADKNIDFIITDKKEKIVHEKLWNHGVLIGHIDGIVKVSNCPFVKQIMLGVRTEQGIKIASSVFYQESKKEVKGSKQKEISEMMIAKNILIESMIKLLDRHQEVVPSLQKKANDEIIRQAETIAKLARITKKETLNIFLYNSKIELMRTQLMMIDLADHLISYADEGDEKIRKIYYETLKLILNRGELDISQIGFDESFNFLLDQASLANRKLDKNTLLKMDVGLAYQQFLYKALEKVLHKLNLKGGEEKEMDFIDNFCAIAYFQIPEFRIKLLECAQKETDTEITEWRGTEWKLEDLVMDNQRDQYLLSLFNWEAVFYRFLKTDPREEKNSKKLKEILEKNDWKKRINKRGVAFFNFLGEWAQYIKKKVVLHQENFAYQDIMGYRVLLKAMFCELKSQAIPAYSTALKIATMKMLLNEKLLNTYVAIVYKKTRVYDSKNVSMTFDLINEWMSYLSIQKKKIPNSFDYDFFFEGFRRVFELDSSFSIAKALYLLYKNFNLFTTDFQKQVCDFIFSKVFFRFFMHWSKNVRVMFHHFLLYRVYHLHRNMKTAISKIEDITIELMAYNHKRKLNKLNPKDRQNLINDLINMKYSKLMIIIENTKVKIEKEEEIKQTTDFFLEGGSGPSNNKIAFLKQKLHERQQKMIKKLSKTNDIGKFFPKPFQGSTANFNIARDASFLLINSASFEIDNQALKDRSYSMVLKTSYTEENTKPDSNFISQAKIKSITDLNPLKDNYKSPKLSNSQKIKKEEKITAISSNDKEKKNFFGRSNTEFFKRDDLDDINTERKTEQIVVNKRFMYYDDEGQNYIELPNESIKYLMIAYNEYEELKKKYVIWYQKQKKNNYSLTREEFGKIMKDIPVPDIIIKLPLDENEQVPTDNEW